jgi:hypothetical protein
MRPLGRVAALRATKVRAKPVGAPLRQWVLTVPFAWRKRLGYDGPLLRRPKGRHCRGDPR